MGICSSYESTSVATVKLILHDGRLQEFSYPVKASYLLQNDPTIFICNSDEMDFGDVVSAISAEEELQLGQLYFALPLSRLKCRLQAEEMAALAVKASSALNNSGDGEKCLILFEKGGGKFSKKVVDNSGSRGRNNRGGSARRKKFTAKLSAINE
ncbi:uncharacterized protein LOC107781171 [Nicotiana tabacum]|uniref:Uncharacterized protein LOC107781171 n=2 Tax=Nicotiana TaxID=4085 RepID=A0A1S3YZP4_TOBAC|nr:PREDICTED: uncharacterized protein LOC104225500 [Nicotiana sylvestris]XP_016457317.1 PREDICTED: uncharacterized protein LOC107781171 [Nicotiana tabacum]